VVAVVWVVLRARDEVERAKSDTPEQIRRAKETQVDYAEFMAGRGI
jgi:hypothetical protein